MPGQRQLERLRTANLFKNTIKKCLKRPEKLTVSQWAEKYRDLGNTSAFPGRWSNDVTPYLVGIMDAFSDPYIREINFCKPTQVGGTEVIHNMLGYIIMQSQAPTMLIYPTDDLAKDLSKDRLVPSLIQTKEIREAYDDRRSKQLAVKFGGMTVYLTGAGNPGKLSNKPIKYMFFDEIDKLGGASEKEASPYSLAKERTRTYPYSRKIYTCSTPTIKENYVWRLHEKAEMQYEYFVPCPHCQTYFIFDFNRIIYSDDKILSNEERAATAMYFCEECGCAISDKDKIRMLRKGQWRDVKGTCRRQPKKVSFHLNCLYSRFLTWQDIVLEYLSSKDDPEEYQNFVNSWLAQPWEDSALKTSVDLVMQRQTDVPELVVPEWAKLLTGGVDVQHNCLYWTIRAWGNYITSQNIAHGQVTSFDDIERIMNLNYAKESNECLPVALCLIDSGDQTDDVYEFCLYNSDWALPCKGASRPMTTDFRHSTINKEHSKAKGMDLVIIDTGKYKDKIAARMQRSNGEGAWMVYAGCDEEYAKQVTAEHKVFVRTGKKKEKRWVQKASHNDNHYLDTEVYSYAAAEIMGVKQLYQEDNLPNPTSEEPSSNEIATPEEDWIAGNENWI